MISFVDSIRSLWDAEKPVGVRIDIKWWVLQFWHPADISFHLKNGVNSHKEAGDARPALGLTNLLPCCGVQHTILHVGKSSFRTAPWCSLPPLPHTSSRALLLAQSSLANPHVWIPNIGGRSHPADKLYAVQIVHKTFQPPHGHIQRAAHKELKNWPH